jgi:hypothetical protein
MKRTFIPAVPDRPVWADAGAVHVTTAAIAARSDGILESFVIVWSAKRK